MFVAAAILLSAGCTGSASKTEIPSDDSDSRPPCLGKCDQAADGGLDLSGYDFIVVGAGAGGGPLAANLARAGHEVLLLEAGSDVGGSIAEDAPPQYNVPAFHTKATQYDGMQWDYYVDHYSQPEQSKLDSKYTYRTPSGELTTPITAENLTNGWEPGGYSETVPEGSEPLGVLYPRAATLGGSTAHNAMITVYPHESDWNYLWQLTGDVSWKSTHMRHYLKLLERNRYMSRDDAIEAGHGVDGWLQTELADPQMAIRDTKLRRIITASTKAFAEEESDISIARTAEELKRLLTGDMNERREGKDVPEGVFNIPLATENGERISPREYIISTARNHPLTVRMHALVTNVTFKEAPSAQREPVANGVEFLSGPHLYEADPQAQGRNSNVEKLEATVRDGGEVILSAGAFNTPQLLMLSGIGPRPELREHGIETRVARPGVGRNLQDRYEAGIVAELRRQGGGNDGEQCNSAGCPSPIELTENCRFEGSEADPCYREWKNNATGPYTSNGGVAALIRGSSQARLNPDLFIFGLVGAFRGYYPDYDELDTLADSWHFTWAILKGHTRNRAGRVRLDSSNPTDTPDIDFNFFEDGGQKDLTAVVEGVQFVRKMIAASNSYLQSLPDGEDGDVTMREVWPGPDVTGEELQQFIRTESWGHHACCTAKIGAEGDEFAVLDSEFRVRGVDKLRVVDASVFPKIPGFFIVLPIYMASEKATNDILADHGHPRWNVYVSHAAVASTDPNGNDWDLTDSEPEPLVEMSVSSEDFDRTRSTDSLDGFNPDWQATELLSNVPREVLEDVEVTMFDDDITDEKMCSTSVDVSARLNRTLTTVCERDGKRIFRLHWFAEPAR